LHTAQLHSLRVARVRRCAVEEVPAQPRRPWPPRLRRPQPAHSHPPRPPSQLQVQRCSALRHASCRLKLDKLTTRAVRRLGLRLRVSCSGRYCNGARGRACGSGRLCRCQQWLRAGNRAQLAARHKEGAQVLRACASPCRLSRLRAQTRCRSRSLPPRPPPPPTPAPQARPAARAPSSMTALQHMNPRNPSMRICRRHRFCFEQRCCYGGGHRYSERVRTGKPAPIHAELATTAARAGAETRRTVALRRPWQLSAGPADAPGEALAIRLPAHPPVPRPSHHHCPSRRPHPSLRPRPSRPPRPSLRPPPQALMAAAPICRVCIL
jgi:hypothetical protein